MTLNYKVVTVDQARDLIKNNSDIVLLDVRTQEEHEGELGHLPNSLLIPVQELGNRMNELEVFRGKTILAYCRTGNRSGKAASFLAQHGFTAINMDGGMVQWNKQCLPVVRGRE